MYCTVHLIVHGWAEIFYIPKHKSKKRTDTVTPSLYTEAEQDTMERRRSLEEGPSGSPLSFLWDGV